MPRRPATEADFWAKVARTDTCWLWIGNKVPGGYGQFYYKGKPQLVHRLSWEFTHGPIPEGKLILHKCDVRNCLNPNHLFLGDHSENLEDMYKKGRAAVFKACRNGHTYKPGSYRINKKDGSRVCRQCERDRKRRYLSTRA